MHLTFDEKEEVPVKAYPINPKQGITFQFRGVLTARTPSLGHTEKRPPVNIFGISEARLDFQQTHEFMLVNVEFQPCALSHFLKINMCEIPGGNVDASLLLGKEVESVNDALANTPGYEDIPHILNNYFIKKIKQLNPDFLPIDSIGSFIYYNPLDFKLDKTAKEACMSHRNFEYKFMHRTGVTPKYFARMCRFYQAYEIKEMFPSKDWLSIAVQNGYTDYQHLVRDCKHFAEVTPRVFLEHVNLNPEKRLQANPDFVGI
ncbi:MAG: AraC family transcriptional regulator [Chitinophagaceae bacterium]|nr:AraC family transcriptional regulator [Chitinophagaceae bacterium]